MAVLNEGAFGVRVNRVWRGGGLGPLLALISALLIPTTAQAQAQAQVWQVGVQPGGYGVAHIKGAGPATGLALTCERNTPVLALSLARPAARNPAPFTLAVGGRVAQGALTRNGATNVWVMFLRDSAMVDLLTQGESVTVTIAGAPYGALSLQGARPAIQQALSRCYTPPTQVAVTPPRPAGGSFGTILPGAARPTVTGADAPVRGLYQDLTGSGEGMARWFTASYRALEAECGRAQDLMVKRGFEDDAFGQCGEDASSLCQCQDMDDQVLRRTLAVSAVAASPGVARVEARFRIFADGDPITVPFRVVRTAQGWLIDDIIHGTGGSGERALFLQGINAMRKALKVAPLAPPPLTSPVE